VGRLSGVLIVILLLGSGLVYYLYKNSSSRQAEVATSPTPAPTPLPTATPLIKIKELPITLPMIDALFFVDRQFADELKKGLQLTDEQVAQLRQAARDETAKLREPANAESATTTLAAGERAAERVGPIVGQAKAQQFADFALRRWQLVGSLDNDALVAEAPLPSASPLATLPLATPSPLTTPTPGGTPAVTPTPIAPTPAFAAPADTRILVNTPAHRLDVFQNGQLLKSYKISIGYPEFPLPTGLRKASSIIFNPTWTPPDEPWVESSKTVKVGQTVAAGDKLNPLGPIKIPIGMPSLIHGGKSLAKIGTFGSHGCVGMTDRQVQDFAKLLGSLGGVELTDEQIAAHAKKRTETKSVKLKQAVPVELRYETITVENGKLHVYRDVYGLETNVPENLEAVLSTYGITLADLSETERAEADAALTALSRKAVKKTETPATATPLSAEQKAEQRKQKLEREKLMRRFRGKKEAVIEIAALAGKGYPAPVELDTGSAAKPAAKATDTGKRKP
jgi:lipoprotein-anchoring transpeptidase ErfK/SrfK